MSEEKPTTVQVTKTPILVVLTVLVLVAILGPLVTAEFVFIILKAKVFW